MDVDHGEQRHRHDVNGAADFGDAASPFPPFTCSSSHCQSTILAIVFFVTSGDSGALVLSNFVQAQDVNDADLDAHPLACVIGLLTLALVMAGGLSAAERGGHRAAVLHRAVLHDGGTVRPASEGFQEDLAARAWPATFPAAPARQNVRHVAGVSAWGVP